MKIWFDGKKLGQIAERDGCFVMAVTPATVAVLSDLQKIMKWPTRWHTESVPAVGWKIIKELDTMCNLDDLVHGDCVQNCYGGGGGGGVGTIYPDGTLYAPPAPAIPPRYIHEQYPPIEPNDKCRLAYAAWEYGETILKMLKEMQLIAAILGGAAALAAVAGVVFGIIPLTWTVLLGGSSIVTLTAVLASLATDAGVIALATEANEGWSNDKDEIICRFVQKLTSGVDIENEFMAALSLVYGGLLDDVGLIDIKRIATASGLRDWVGENIFDGGDFAPIDMPDDYQCTCGSGSYDGHWMITKGADGVCEDDATVHLEGGDLDVTAKGSITKLNNTSAYNLYLAWDVRETFISGAMTVKGTNALRFEWQQNSSSTSNGVDLTDGEEHDIDILDGSDLEYLRIISGFGSYTKDCPVELPSEGMRVEIEISH